MLILGQRHLTTVLTEYARHYNDHRPRRALGQRPPTPAQPPPSQPVVKVQRHPILGGLTNEYAQAA
jgi:hypothetical protein